MENKNEAIFTLRFLDDFYERSQRGCSSLEISTDHNLISDLLNQELIFKTSEGYFISTLGKEYLLNNQ